MKVFEIDDLVLGVLKLQDPCPIKITIDEKFIKLYVGPRDWEWHVETGKLSSCGTTI